MGKVILLFFSFFFISKTEAQVEVVKLIGKNSTNYNPGYGAFLKIGVPVTEAAEVNAELSAFFIFAKSGGGAGIGLTPLKIGYRYIPNGTSSGFYIEPQVGYTFYKDTLEDGEGPFNGPVWALGGGYLFDFGGKTGLNTGLRYESVIYKGGSLGYLALRISATVIFGRRENH